jgi:hypothetical protein
MLDWEKSMRNSNKNTPRDAEKLGDKGSLSLRPAHMLQHRIGAGDVKRVGREGQGSVWLDLSIVDLRKGGDKVVSVSEARRGDALLARVQALNQVRALVDYIRDSNIKDTISFIRPHFSDKILINAIARSNHQALCQ